MEEDKKLKLQDEIQKIIDNHQQNNMIDIVEENDNKILGHRIEKAPPALPCLSSNVSIDFAPSRGRFAVANR